MKIIPLPHEPLVPANNVAGFELVKSSIGIIRGIKDESHLNRGMFNSEGSNVVKSKIMIESS